jgi:hypothetical protein
MKGLSLAHVNKTDPVARDLVNQGLRYNLKSHTCTVDFARSAGAALTNTMF